MKIFFSLLFSFFSVLVVAQQDRKALILNKELKVLAGNWAGPVVFTDPLKNDAQVSFQAKLLITDLGDSLALEFSYTDADGKETMEKTFLRILDKEDMLRLDGELYDIGFTGRKGPRLTIIAEKQGMDNSRVADLKQTIIFGPANLSMVKEVRYMENEFYFIRRRATFTKK
jgi:hypothetical protein